MKIKNAFGIFILILLPMFTFAETDSSFNKNYHHKKISHHKKNKTKILVKKKCVEPRKSNSSDDCKIKFSGFIDGSYNYLFRSNQLTSGTFNRVFDIDPNGFTLHQAAVTVAFQPKCGLGILVTPVVGRDNYTFAPYGWNPDTGSQQLAFSIPEVYLQFAWDKFTIMAGNFLELAGAETLYSIRNTNFSRGILYGYAEPFTVTGIRLRYIFNDQLTLFGGFNNGWDNIRDTSRRKTIEASFTYIPCKLFTLAGTLYSGGQRAADRTDFGPQSRRNLYDFIFTIHATDKLDFILNYDYGIQPVASLPEGNLAEAVWHGIAGYINYKFNDCWKTSIRGEIFSDRNGYRTGVAQVWKELTLTLGYTPFKCFELRGEVRHDFSNVNSFLRKNRIGTINNQQSVALEGILSFG